MKLPTLAQRKSLFNAAQQREKLDKEIEEREKEKQQKLRELAEMEKARPKIDKIKKAALTTVIKAVEQGKTEAVARTFGYEPLVWKAAGLELMSENTGYLVEYKSGEKFIELHHNDMHYSPDSVTVFETALVISWKN